MAGIYFHIPFCKQACHYCDFHFSTSLKHKTPVLEAMHTELEKRAEFLKGMPIETVYFGGGTPSILSADEIDGFIQCIANVYNLQEDAEITLEANPDDLNPVHIQALKKTAVNRFSIGIQSFFDEDLLWMNRAHNGTEAKTVIPRIQDAGFENITADLIYGYPLLTDSKWKDNIETLTSMGIPHLSAYSMTVESKTALHSMIRKGKQHPMDDQQSARQFVYLMEYMERADYLHYEISNWAKPFHEARHNSNYWKGVPYLGIGPSAHSYKHSLRQSNIANNALYLKGVESGEWAIEQEVLTKQDQLHEYLMTSLRTHWGIEINWIATHINPEAAQRISGKLEQQVKSGHVIDKKDRYVLSRSGKLLADHITTLLFD